jgi:tetratricopeptide (TPR) repeat protein
MVDITELPEVTTKTKRYIPGPGDPELPPQLSQMADKSTDELMKELNRLPFFMTKLDETDGSGGENVELEALKALAYDGEPDEVATNFKNQGNERFRAKQYKSAVDFYNKGLAVECDVPNLNASLYSNRAACNLELKNYRRCINDCKEVLKLDPKNIKAYYRMSKAFFSIEQFDEAKQALEFSLKISPDNLASQALLRQIAEKELEIERIREKRENDRIEKLALEELLKDAIQARGYTNISTPSPAELTAGSKMHLEDAKDIESQLILPAMIIYPTTDEFDFVAEISELSTPLEIMELVLDRPQEWFEHQKHKDFSPKKLDAYMESGSGGLIKVGKKATLNKALSTQTPKIPLFDNGVRLYFVPKVDAEKWLSTWSKEVALKKRFEIS